MRWISDEDVKALGALDAESVGRVLDLAGRVYRYIKQNPWIADETLRTYAEANGIAVDDLNAALAFLQAQKRVFLVPVESSPVVEEPVAAAPKRTRTTRQRKK
jgi:hypothetical protein